MKEMAFDDATDAILNRLQAQDPAVRYAAWHDAAVIVPTAIPEVAALAASPDKGVAKAARAALEVRTHVAGTPGRAADARAVSDQLMRVAIDSSRPVAVRSQALRLTALIGDSHVVARLAALLADSTVRDEARMCLEIIPGDASLHALQGADKHVPDAFRPSIQQSILARTSVD